MQGLDEKKSHFAAIFCVKIFGAHFSLRNQCDFMRDSKRLEILNHPASIS